MPPEPSVTSACEGPRSCTLRYSSALLPKSFERPGPKSEPGDVLLGPRGGCLVQVDRGHASPLSLPETPGILSLVLITPVDTAHTGVFSYAATNCCPPSMS